MTDVPVNPHHEDPLNRHSLKVLNVIDAIDNNCLFDD